MTYNALYIFLFHNSINVHNFSIDLHIITKLQCNSNIRFIHNCYNIGNLDCLKHYISFTLYELKI